MARLASASLGEVEAGGMASLASVSGAKSSQADMSYITYILLSKVAKKTYVGHTDNLVRRLNEHNGGKSIFSKRYKPWIVLYNESHPSEMDAIKRERYFKSAAGRRWMRKIYFSRSGGMVDTQRSERCPSNGVEVQLLSSAHFVYNLADKRSCERSHLS